MADECPMAINGRIALNKPSISVPNAEKGTTQTPNWAVAAG